MVLQLLHAVLVPVVTVVKGKRLKYSIKQSQESFMIICPNSNEAQRKISEKRGLCVHSNTCQQPLIIVIGQDENYSDFLLDFDGNLYKFDSFLEVIIYCFQLLYVLNLKYPDECIVVWNFIEKFLFGIISSTTAFPKVDTFITDIKSGNI